MPLEEKELLEAREQIQNDLLTYFDSALTAEQEKAMCDCVVKNFWPLLEKFKK